MRPDDVSWMTFGEVRELIKAAKRLNSMETSVVYHQCAEFEGFCIRLEVIDGHELCEKVEE